MDRIRILYVHHQSSIAGSTMSLLYLIRELDRSRYSPSVLFLGGSGDVVPLFQEQNIPVYTLNGVPIFSHAKGGYVPWFSKKMLNTVSGIFRIKSSVVKIERFLMENEFDVIHLNTSVLLVVAIAANRSKSKVVWHIREELPGGLLGFRRCFLRHLILRYATRIICISETNARKVGTDQKVRVVYNWVDFKRFVRNINTSNFKKANCIDSEDKVFCMLGGAQYTKGADVFLRAAELVLKEYPHTFFLIAGQPLNPIQNCNRLFLRVKYALKYILTGERNMHYECTKILKRNKLLNAKVKFLGLRLDMPELLASSDALVWPASVSHFSRPIIEASAMAKPSIASDFESSREIVEHGKNGLLFKPNNYKELAKFMKYIIENPSDAAKIGENAYEIAREQFNSEINSKAIIDVYDELMTC